MHEQLKEEDIPYDKILSDGMPTTPDQERDAKQFNDFLKQISIDANSNYVAPPAVIRIKDAVIATNGNFSASVGRPKSRKTFNVSALTAALISGKTILGYEAHMPAGKDKVLYIDTEQSILHCHRVMDRILLMAGISPKDAHKHITFLALRRFSPHERRNIVSKALRTDRSIGFAVIDGIRDLLTDINSTVESVEIINDLMHWSQGYGIHIHTVLHLNKNDDNARGHIGTELYNKAETIMLVKKSSSDPHLSDVLPMVTRDLDFNRFSFFVNSQGIPELAKLTDDGDKDEKISMETLTSEHHRTALENAFANNEMMSYGELITAATSAYAQIGYKRSRTRIVNLIKKLTTLGIIVRQDNKTYSLCEDKIYQLNNDED